MTFSEDPRIVSTDLMSASAAFIGAVSLPEPAFDFTIGLAESHIELLESRFAEEGDPQILLQAAWSRGRVLLHGEGGVGKSTIAKGLLVDACNKGNFAALVDLRDWSPDILDAWGELAGISTARADLLLEELACPRFSEADLAVLSEGTRALIVLDGLNETPGPTAGDILEVADGIARRNPHTGILVTDRLLRRALPGRRWQLAVVSDVSVANAPVSFGALARGNAFFLSLAMQDPVGDVPAVGILDEYLSRHIGLVGESLGRAAIAAADAYLESASRVFDLDRFTEIAGHDAVEVLAAGGVLRAHGPDAVFRHHLFHDDLAARWLASEGDAAWNVTNYEAFTFRANSFDVLALALARITDAEDAHRFVLSVYDYNYYGTAYALAEGIRLGATGVDPDTYLAIVSMLAERRFDPMLPTFEQVEDALRLFEDPIADSLRKADSVEALLREVAASEVAHPLIKEWQSLFVTPPGSPAEKWIVDFLVGENALLGWTAANVLRRTTMEPEELGRVWSILAEDDRPVVRWRAAHALGCQPDPRSVGRLFDATHDPDSLVRYGAVRSLVDMAAANVGRREEILLMLEEDAARLARDPRPARELERSLQRVNHDPAWIEAITPLVQELWSKAPTIERREHWRAVARQIANPSGPEAGTVQPAA